jgi:hypothetical protein
MTHQGRPIRFALDQAGIAFLGAPGALGTKSERGDARGHAARDAAPAGVC